LHAVVANGHGGSGFILGQSGNQWVVLVGGVGFTALAKVQPATWTHLAIVKSAGWVSGWVEDKPRPVTSRSPFGSASTTVDWAGVRPSTGAEPSQAVRARIFSGLWKNLGLLRPGTGALRWHCHDAPLRLAAILVAALALHSAPSVGLAKTSVGKHGNSVVLQNDLVRGDYDLASGTYSARKQFAQATVLPVRIRFYSPVGSSCKTQ
jgi:hypothetical protein